LDVRRFNVGVEQQSTEIINAIGSVGFPIVACGALFWMINTTMKELKQAIDQLSDAINGIKDGEHDR
jgi:RNA-splicing ligase RtcB